jgi:phosphate transport system protein
MIHLQPHASASFDQGLETLFSQLEAMRDHLLQLSGHIRSILGGASLDLNAVRAIEQEINALEYAIDQQVIHILSRYSPMADELRLVLAAIKVASACERAADQLKNTAKRLGRIEGVATHSSNGPLAILVDQVTQQIGDVLDHLDALDDEKMARILAEREAIHASYKQALTQLPQTEQAVELAFIWRNIERVSELMYDIAKIAYAAVHGRKYVKLGL